jgi:hypothetical protein
MLDLRMVLPVSPPIIRAWLISLVDRIIPLDPDPSALGQPQIAPHSFATDATLRRQPTPAEIEDTGGFSVGLEMAISAGDGEVQPVGPVVVFLVVPMGIERSEFRIFFPLGITIESRQRLVNVLSWAWPGEAIHGDQVPWWAFRDFNRRALFEAIATQGPLPPGAPPRRPGAPPWRVPFTAKQSEERIRSEQSREHADQTAPSPDSGTADLLPPTYQSAHSRDAFDYSLPTLTEGDLILEARSRLHEAPPDRAFPRFSLDSWLGDDDLSFAMRKNHASWERSTADADRLFELGWPTSAIGVWCYPYLYDLHLAQTKSKEHAAQACAQHLEREGRRAPSALDHDTTLGKNASLDSTAHLARALAGIEHADPKTTDRGEGNAAIANRRTGKRSRPPLLSEDQFRQRLDDAGRRLLTGDAGGVHLSAADKTLIQKQRHLTKKAVAGLVGIGRGTLDSYLGSCRIEWGGWKVGVERRYAGQKVTPA